MPDRESQAKLKERLKARYRELREQIREELLQSDEQHFIDLAGQVHDLEEESVADLLVDLDLEIIDRHIEELRDIDAALMRMAYGSYGICEDCDETISPKRLEARPTARRCTPCQARYEREHAGNEHHTF